MKETYKEKLKIFKKQKIKIATKRGRKIEKETKELNNSFSFSKNKEKFLRLKNQKGFYLTNIILSNLNLSQDLFQLQMNKNQITYQIKLGLKMTLKIIQSQKQAKSQRLSRNQQTQKQNLLKQTKKDFILDDSQVPIEECSFQQKQQYVNFTPSKTIGSIYSSQKKEDLSIMYPISSIIHNVLFFQNYLIYSTIHQFGNLCKQIEFN
ncbi:hypothetical protein TTHERM_000574229 (macronuclear) [Tetrahymena thermophila SB210]|uniref:Uncharacterized protein n=1 Tax=Tetrahymena thermophila (strain SB210) TaxID=312017 RepID=W7XDT2_TETTS|nr:hypothetical protein TTHERM_000574229 [Tetrahymena thermophila SB210]EWS75752.1 hypothetical protein TTHERM_000574229 [Tetrahymena thermophila SB210]|eukprot:XP_012651674.1 hypothetical protein TTHERM_000574229 [Tetrahymena thermophila SB210]